MNTTTATKIQIIEVDNVGHASHDVEAHSADCDIARRRLNFRRSYTDAGVTSGASMFDVWANYNGDFEGADWDIRFYPCTGLVSDEVDFDGNQN